jgi:hypothetical protein
MFRRLAAGVVVAAATALALPALATSASAATTVSTPASPAGWSVANRPGGAGVRLDPTYAANPAPHLGGGALRLNTPAEDDQVATYYAVTDTSIGDVDELSFDWYKTSTPVQGGSAGQSVAYVVWVKPNLDPDPAEPLVPLTWEPLYQPNIIHPDNVLPTNVWMHSNLTAAGTNCWGDTGECHTWQSFQAQYPFGVVVAYGLNQGTSNPGVVSYADNVSFRGNAVNFELNPPAPNPPTVTVAPQGTTSQTWSHGGNPALGGIKVEAWVDIERTCSNTNVCTYRVRGHDRVSKVGSTVRVQSDAARLGSPDRAGYLAADGARNSGNDNSSVESMTPWVAVRAGTLCSNPFRLWTGVTASARWADTKSTTVTARSNATTSRVCA